MRKLINFAIPVCFSLLLLNCSSGDNISDCENKLEYEVVTGSGGGFTGAKNGFIIDTAGNVYSWNGITTEAAKKKSEGKLSCEQIGELNSVINSSELFNVEFKEHGNMTSFISLKKQGNKTNISWNDNKKADLPESIKKFNGIISEILKNIKSGS